jgi:hypothetical protein
VFAPLQNEAAESAPQQQQGHLNHPLHLCAPTARNRRLAAFGALALILAAVIAGFVIVGRANGRPSPSSVLPSATPTASPASQPQPAATRFDAITRGLTPQRTSWFTLWTGPTGQAPFLLELSNSTLAQRRCDQLFAVVGMVANGDGSQSLFHSPLTADGNWFCLSFAEGDPLMVDIRSPDMSLRDRTASAAYDAGGRFYRYEASLKMVAVSAAAGTVLVDGTAWFTGGLGVLPPAVVRGASFVRVQSARLFDRNLELSLLVAPGGQQEAVVAVRVSARLLPAVPMIGRAAHDAVGFFTEAYSEVGAPSTNATSVRVIHRWRLEKKNPGPGLSDPVSPIIYYIDPSVPERWRPAIKRGVENWQKAFTAAGFSNAIKAVLPTDTALWPADYDAANAKYSTISWTIDVKETFGLGPSDVDPRSGEILNADIIITNGWTTYYEDMEVDQIEGRGGSGGSGGSGGGAALLLRALHGGVLPEELADQGLTDVTMHEVGHTLGLRHNFMASTYRTFADMQTTTEGIYSSVMDYSGVNIPSSPTPQGKFFMDQVGDYDVNAIRYGYGWLDGEQDGVMHPALAALADSAVARGLHFCTDEDDATAAGQNHLCSYFDQSKNPLDFFEDRNKLAAKLLPTVRPRLMSGITDSSWTHYYAIARSLLAVPHRGAQYAAKMLGGVAVLRASPGSGINPNLYPSEADQLRAISLIADSLTKAVPAAPDLADFGLSAVTRTGSMGFRTPSLLQQLLQQRNATLDTLLDPGRIARIRQASLQGSGMPLSAILGNITARIWSADASRPDQRDLRGLWIDKMIAAVKGTDAELASIAFSTQTAGLDLYLQAKWKKEVSG